MQVVCLRLIALAAVCLSHNGAVGAEDATARYEARYQITGYLLRAANVCMGSKEQVDATLALVKSPEMVAFSRAFPKMTETWMDRGATMFNTSVMDEGLQPACDYALKTLKKAASP